MKKLLCILSLGLCLVACGTVSPNYPEARTIGFGDDGIQDAGVKGQVVNVKTGEHYVLLQSSDRNQYNNDVIQYGSLFNPALVQDIGILPYHQYYAFRNDVLVDFATMEAFRAMDLPKRR